MNRYDLKHALLSVGVIEVDVYAFVPTTAYFQESSFEIP